MKTQDALRLARERGFDLMEVAAKTDPPVTRFVDYGKYLYQQAKIAKKSAQKKSEVKSIRVKVNASKHDQETKAKKVHEFLNKGHKVHLEMYLRGRERALKDHAQAKFQEFLSIIKDYKTDQEIEKLPNGFSITIFKK